MHTHTHTHTQTSLGKLHPVVHHGRLSIQMVSLFDVTPVSNSKHMFLTLNCVKR